MDKCLLVDGHNLLFQMFFGMPSRIYGKNNIPIHGVIGFIGALIKTIKAVEATKVIVLFDNEHGSNRDEVNPDYKANRVDYSCVPEIDNPFSQLPYIKQALDCMEIMNTEVECGYETDDVIGSYCINHCENTHFIIMSHDSDYFQLVCENVSLYKYRGKKSQLYDVKDVLEKYGIYPSQFVDYKALMGDSSDNIKGVPKIGHKTAQRLLAEYGNAENIISNIATIKPIHISKSMAQNVDLINNNIKIIKLNGDVKLPFQMDEINPLYNTEELQTMNILRKINLVV